MRLRIFPAVVTAALVLISAAGWSALTVSPRLKSGPTSGAASPQVSDIRARLKKGERVSLIANLKLSYTDAKGKSVPIADIERAKVVVIKRLAGRRGIASVRSIPNATSLRVVVTSVAGFDRVLADPMVANVWENRTLTPLASESREIVHATEPWNDDGTNSNTSYSGVGFAVAVVDTGVDSADFPGAMQAEACFSDPDPASYVDTLCPSSASTPGNTLNDPGSAAPCVSLVGCDHGTHVAGIAVGNTARPGVAPDAHVVAIQVFANNNGALLTDSANIKAALAYVQMYNANRAPAENKIISVNMSLGALPATVSDCTLGGGIGEEIVALKKQGVTVVAASGNDGKANIISWPACINIAPSPTTDPLDPNYTPNDTSTDAGVVSVGATNKWDVVATFSNSGPTSSFYKLDLLAPGAGINALVPGGGVAHKSGTSMAAPHVAGCVALLANEATAMSSMPPDTTAASAFETAMEATGLPVTDWRDYSITTPRLDCGAALWNLAGKDHLAKIKGTKRDTAGNPMGAGWLIEAYSVGEPWPAGYVGHPSASALTTATGDYEIQVPWGIYQLQESRYGPAPHTAYWTQIAASPPPVDVNPNAMGPFSGYDFENRNDTATICPAGQTYTALTADQKDHYAMPLDGSASPNSGLQAFFSDRYSPHPPVPMKVDENNWSTRAFIHTFDLAGAAGIPANAVVTKARFDIGARPVVQPPTKTDGTYIDDKDRLERNDAMWLLFTDPYGGILGNPTAWGHSIGPISLNPNVPGALLGKGLLTTHWDYPNQQVRYDFKLSLPALPFPSPVTGLPPYVDGDIRPMIDLHRQVGLFFQDDTGIDYAVLHLCTRVPEISITKGPTEGQYRNGASLTFDLTVTNTGINPIPASGTALLVSDELPAGFDLTSPYNVSGTYTSWATDWSCAVTAGSPGFSKFICKYTGTGLAPAAATTIHVPVTAIAAGTHQNCASVDVFGNFDILDHNSACNVSAVGYDIGVRKRKSEYMIKWDNPDTPLIDPDSSVAFTLGVRNYGQELHLPQATITLGDAITHNGFQYIAGSLIAPPDWTCPTPTLPLSVTCTYNGASLSPPGVVPPGFEPQPLHLERGYELPRVQVQVRGNETGWWQNCATATLSGYTDEAPANDRWCVNVFVQGNIAVEKKTGHTNNEYDYDLDQQKSELIDLTINVSNLAGKIDAPLEIEVKDKLPVGFYLDDPSGFVTANQNDWTCTTNAPNYDFIDCKYKNLPISSASGFPIVPVPLVPIQLNVRAGRPGIYRNCAVGLINAPATPIDDQPDAISPPDPPPPIQTDFEPINNDGCTRIVVGHDVRMTKSASNVTPNAGQAFTYDIQFTNHWSSVGPNEKLHFTDTLPSGVTHGALPIASGPGVWDCSLSTPTFIDCVFDTGPTVYPAGDANSNPSTFPSLSIPVTAPATAGAYENCADLDVQLQSDEDDAPGNNTHACVTINVPAHLSMTKVSDKTEYDLPDQITFTLTVTNPAQGSPGWGSIIPAGLINFIDTASPSLTLVSANWPAAWGCSTSSWSCSPSVPINAPDTFTFTIVAVASQPGHYTNCLTDGPPSGNDPCVDFYVGHDVAISKSVDNATPPYGSTVTFTLPVSNNLSSVASPTPEAIGVMDVLPMGLVPNASLIAANLPNWNCTINLQTVICAYNFPAPPGTVLPPVTIQATVAATDPVDNCATAILNGNGITDDIPANNGPACVTVTPQKSYLAVYKAYSVQDDLTPGGTQVPSAYASGFPISLTCSSFVGTLPLPLQAGQFSTNDPNLAANPPTGFTSVSGSNPSTVPTAPGTTCTVSEQTLPSVPAGDSSVCNGGSATWVTSYEVNGAPAATGAVPPMVAGQTSTVTVKNTLKCDKGYFRIWKEVQDVTGGSKTEINAAYSSGFPIDLTCTNHPGIWIHFSLPAPVPPGLSCSTNNPALTVCPGAPSTGPSPVGVSCTVSENNGYRLPLLQTSACNAAPYNGYAAWSLYLNPTSGTAPIGPDSGPTAFVHVRNNLNCVQTGRLLVNKIVASDAAAVSASTNFALNVQCTNPSNLNLGTADYSLAMPGGGSGSITSVTGDVCTVSEPTLPPPFTYNGQTCTWNPPVVTPVNPQIGVDSSVTVTNSYTCSP